MTPSLHTYLVRHGEAVPGPVDAERPLTAGGRRSFQATARRLVERSVVVAEIQHSGLLRAWQTADSLAAALGPPRGIREVDALGPEDDPEEARGRLEASTEPLLLVGHLPHLARLVAALVGKDGMVAFQPATVVCLARGVGAWTIEWVLDSPPAPTAP